MTSIDGEFTQKFTLRSQETKERIVSKLKSDLAASHWKLVQRGKVAVRISFFARSSEVPLLHNLVKYYMDLLKGLFFTDDRQVYYLEAYCYRMEGGKSRVYLAVERLSTYQQKLKSYFEFKDQFDDDWFHDVNVELSSESLAGLSKAHRQKLVLESSKIEAFDQPGDLNDVLAAFIRYYQAAHPYVIDLGDMPDRAGESKEYKTRVRERLNYLTKRNAVFDRIVIPVELDVQVTPKALSLGKDLDNIMVDLCRPFTEDVLGRDGYLNAFRIYVTDRLATDVSGGIRIKLLPYGAINEFGCSVTNVLTRLAKYLEEKN